MSNSLRFLGLAVFAWAGVRAASLGLYPGSTSVAPPPKLTIDLPPVAQTEFEPPPPPDPLPQPAYYPPPPGYGPPYANAYPQSYPAYPAYPHAQRMIVVPANWSAGVSAPVRRGGQGWAGVMPTPRPIYYVPLQPEPWPQYSRPASSGGRREVSTPVAMSPPPPKPERFDRLQLTAWALLRGVGKGVIPTTSLATGGTLGGSQAGARLTYRFNEMIAASLRSTSSAGGVRGAEAALGIRVTPFRSMPVAFTAERRQRIGYYGGRSAFALFAEGGIYHRELFRKIYLDGYVQGGVVGAHRRDLFIDGGATLARPIWRNFSAGVGIWGAAQTGLYRLDFGPRLTMDVRRGIKVHADYRKRLVGNAAPRSGPALTLAADF